ALRGLLHELDLVSWVKTSGSKGFHIVVPLDGKAGFGDVSRFAHGVATRLVSRDPEHLTQEFSKADRGGRILIDTARNAYSSTFVLVLSLVLDIGVNSVIFMFINVINLLPLTVHNYGKVIIVFLIMQGLLRRNVNDSRAFFSYAEYAAYRDQNHVFTGLAAH